ncbi:MAG: hypothetical protein U0R71_11000 [Solirubrobacterales bacterium]
MLFHAAELTLAALFVGFCGWKVSRGSYWDAAFAAGTASALLIAYWTMRRASEKVEMSGTLHSGGPTGEPVAGWERWAFLVLGVLLLLSTPYAFLKGGLWAAASTASGGAPRPQLLPRRQGGDSRCG